MTLDDQPMESILPTLSPSLQTGGGQAFELKIALPLEQGLAAESWARQRLLPDPHGVGGTYHTLSLYCDTQTLDVFHRTPGFKRKKYRVRRYGDAAEVHLERKARKGDRVRKKREVIPLDHLGLLAEMEPEPDCPYGWFIRQVRMRGLRPTCQVAYDRTAFIGMSADGSIRLTIDRNIVGMPATDWALPAVEAGRPLLPGCVMLELKYPVTLPGLFRELLDSLPPQPGRKSKYRLCVGAWGLA